MKPLLLLPLLTLFFSCLPSPKNGCPSNETSRILSYEATVAFDTITSVVEGKVVNIADGRALSGVEVSIETYKTKTDADGTFTFWHIHEQVYRLTVRDSGYQTLQCDTFRVGNGRGYDLVVGLACR